MGSTDSPRRVLLIAPQPFYEDRGTPIAVRHVVTALSQLGWQVDILTYRVGEDLDLPGVRIFRFGAWLPFSSVPIGFSLKKVLLDILMPGAILRRLCSEKYDCIHAVEEAVYPALFLRRWAKVPVIYDMQSSIAEQLSLHPFIGKFRPGRFLNWLEKKAYTKADAVVCSAGVAQKFLSEPRTNTAREWIFPARYQKSTENNLARIRRELNICDSRKVITYTGNFERNQGISLLIAAIPLMLESYPEMALVMIGASEQDIRKIEAKCAGLVSAGHLKLLPRQSRARVNDYLGIADVAVSPRIDGCNMPLKVFDYLAAGLPVVATNIAAHHALAGKGLVLVPPTARGMADGIVNLLQEPQTIETLRNQARLVAATEFGWSRFCEQVRNVYEPALATTNRILHRQVPTSGKRKVQRSDENA